MPGSSCRLVAVIRSGGQSGVDRAALDVARAAGVPIRGWCPAGGWAEDLPDPPGVLADYPELTPTPSCDPADRTRWNVRDSQATLIVQSPGRPSAGTALTRTVAAELGRPLFTSDGTDPAAVREWLCALGAEVDLNVAGPRHSEDPDGYRRTRALLAAVLQAPDRSAPGAAGSLARPGR